MRVLIFNLLIFCFISLLCGCRCEECFISNDIKFKISCNTCDKNIIRMRYKIIDTSNNSIDSSEHDRFISKGNEGNFSVIIDIGNNFNFDSTYIELYLNDSLFNINTLITKRVFCSMGNFKRCGTNSGFEVIQLFINGQINEGNQLNIKL